MRLNRTASILTTKGSIVAASFEDVDAQGGMFARDSLQLLSSMRLRSYVLANVRLMADTNARIEAFVIDLW